MPDVTYRTVVVDGFTINTTDQGAEAIALMQRRLADAAAATEAANVRIRDAEAANRTALDARDGQVAALRAEMTRVVEAKDGEIAGLRTAHATAIQAKDGEIAALQAQTSDASLDARVAQRAALIAQVRPILGDAFNPAGLTDAAIRKAVVVKAMGPNLTDADAKGDAFYGAAFDTVMALVPAVRTVAAPVDQLRSVIASGPGLSVGDGQQHLQVTPWQAHVNRMQDAWKNPGKEAV